MSLESLCLHSSPGFALARQVPSLWTLLILSLLSFLPSAKAQLVNGQSFTKGLSIINAPAPNSQQHADSTLPISIEVSGDGKIPLQAAVPGSNLPTRFDLLEIYLVSSTANINMTVASGLDLLANEGGSVRHKNFFIPACLPPAQYNLTLYESSHVNDTGLFVITEIPISIDNKNGNNGGDQCVSSNPVQPQPQPGSALPQSPFLPSNPIPVVTTGSATGSVSTINPGTAPVTSGFITTTMLVTSTFTTTAPGQTQGFTSTVTTQVTTTVLGGEGASGFIPANGSGRKEMWSTQLLVLLSLLCLWTSFLL